MQFKIFINYMQGFVDIVVEGFYIERFMNICANQQIFLWNVKKEKETLLYARVGIKDFKRLRYICKKTDCKVKICRKIGIPFILNRYKKRKIFVGLLVILILLVISLSNFVWNIEVTGNNTIPTEEILSIVNSNGSLIGKMKGKIDTKQIINQLRLQRDDLAWVGIELQGTNMLIKVEEADLKPEVIDESEYCNIVAKKPGMVLKISAQNGTPLVNQYDIVKEGDILIGGWIEGKYTGTRYVHAQGDVQAKVWYTNKQKVLLKEIKKEETGEIENKYSVKINNFQINLYKTLSKFENYDTIEKNKKMKIFSNFYLPIELITYTNKEYKNYEVTYTLEEAKNIGISRAEVELQKEIEDVKNVVDKHVNVYENPEYVEVEVTYEVQEGIGTKEKVVF